MRLPSSFYLTWTTRSTAPFIVSLDTTRVFVHIHVRFNLRVLTSFWPRGRNTMMFNLNNQRDSKNRRVLRLDFILFLLIKTSFLYYRSFIFILKLNNRVKEKEKIHYKLSLVIFRKITFSFFLLIRNLILSKEEKGRNFRWF